MFKLGTSKLYGKMVENNFSKTYHFLKKAEQKNVFQSKEVLAKCYYYGVGVENSNKKTIKSLLA